MNAIKDGGPAFPVQERNMFGAHESQGMTLRDYFAAKAIQGFCANTHEQAWTASPADFAEWAYLQADAMLAAREAQP